MQNKFEPLFKSSLNKYTTIIENITKFVEDIKRAIISYDSQEYENTIRLIQEVKLEITTPIIYSSDNIINIENINDIYVKFAKIDSNITQLFKLYSNKNYINYRNSSISVTTAVSEEVNRKITQELFTSVKQINVKNDALIFEESKKYIDKLKLPLFIMKHPEINRFTIFLIGIALKEASRTNLIILRNMIEKYKSESLGASRFNSGHVVSDLNLLSRSNLFPIHNYKDGDIPNIIQGITKSNDVQLEVIKYNPDHKLEYNSSLIGYSIPETSGLNEEILDKTLTIVNFSSDTKEEKKEKKEKMSVDKYGSTDKPLLVMEIILYAQVISVI